jgi:hypothetical protein
MTEGLDRKSGGQFHLIYKSLSVLDSLYSFHEGHELDGEDQNKSKIPVRIN